MSQWLAGARDAPPERAHRVVAAALRAAYAWTVRRSQREAMREVARMTGVVMEAHGPGQGPTTPLDLVDCLRHPLGQLPVVAAAGDETITRTVLLDAADQLTADAYDLACEYALPVGGPPETVDWLPSWTRQHADQIRDEAFQTLREGRSQESYVASRRFLIEHPAGPRAELQELISETGVRPPRRGYADIPGEHLHRAASGETWWWPCPDCRWPMAVSGPTVRCRYRPHAAVYRLAVGRTRSSRPTVTRIDEGRPRGPRPVAQSAADSCCLEFGIWRFVVVPGASELRVARELTARGAAVELWPDQDSYDLRVLAGGQEFRVDLKEYRSPHRLIAALRSRPPRARILLPRTHEHQLGSLRAALPSLQVTTETRFHTEVRRALRTS